MFIGGMSMIMSTPLLMVGLIRELMRLISGTHFLAVGAIGEDGKLPCHTVESGKSLYGFPILTLSILT